MEERHRPIFATLLAGVISPTAAAPLAQPTIAQIDEALRIFGEASVSFSDSERALEWLSTPSDVFGGQAPVALLDSEAGRAQIREALVRIEHGLFF